MGNAGDQPPLSYILFHRRPVSLLSAPEKFPKLSRCRPLPARARESCALSPRGSGTHEGAQGPQAAGGASPFLEGGAEAASPARSSPEPRLQAAVRGKGLGS